MYIQHNMTAIGANRLLRKNERVRSKSQEKLSTGYRINRAADDAAGLSISEKMRGQIRGLNQASRNVQDGISLIQTAEGALQETHSILHRMRELSVQAANDTYVEADREAIQTEMDQLMEEVDRIANHTEYNNGIYPLLGAGDLRSIMLGYLTQKTSTFTATNRIIVDDVTYNPGDSVTVQWVRVDYEINGRKYYYGAMFSGNTSYGAGGLWNWYSRDYPNGPDDSDEMKAVISCYDRSNAMSYSTTINDFGVDENNDIYVRHRMWGMGELEFYDSYMLVDGAVGSGTKGDPNNMKVRSGDSRSQLWIQAGANANQGINIFLVDGTAAGLGLTGVSVLSNKEAGNAIQTVDGAIAQVSRYRSDFGAQQNRLEHAMAVDDNTAENLQVAESRIRDTDMAKEAVNNARNTILGQSIQAMLANANRQTEGMLALLQG